MNKTYLRPSTTAYDGMNSIDEIMGEYNAYLSVLSDKDLLVEFYEKRHEWIESPTILNVRMFQKAKSKVLEKGLLNNQEYFETEREM